jgi:hypothetical protein
MTSSVGDQTTQQHPISEMRFLGSKFDVKPLDGVAVGGAVFMLLACSALAA